MTDAQEIVRLGVDGVEYGGWKDVAITRSIETLANSFDLRLSEKWFDPAQVRPIAAGDACTVSISGETVISGWLDDDNPELDDGLHEVRAAGRDTTGDLVDCSAVHRPGEWRGRTALQLVSALCAPFGIPVSASVDVGKTFSVFKLNEGESVFEAIERICNARALLAVADGKGGLLLMRSGANARRIEAPLVEGVNIKRIAGINSMVERYSEITVKGQQTQLDGMTPEQAAGPSAVARDPFVKRYRPLLIVADEESDGLTAAQRARWEASIRAGRARKAEITVRGWRNETGELWVPNTIIPVRAPTVRVDTEMLIVTVRLEHGEYGELATLGVCRPEAYDLVAIEEKQKKGGAGDELTGTHRYVGSELVKERQNGGQ